MAMRELSSVEVETWRQKGIGAARKIVASFPEHFTTDEKLEVLCREFRACADKCFYPMIDNFRRRNFFERGNHKKGQDLKIMLLGSFQAASKMEEISSQMDGIGRNKMNGHTALYLEQRDECDLARFRLQIAKDLYATNGESLRLSLKDSLKITATIAAHRVQDFVSSRLPRLPFGLHHQ